MSERAATDLKTFGKSYLVQKKKFIPEEENAKAAEFCLRYLNSRPFEVGLNKVAIDEHITTGYYGFLDYATANWWKHVKKVVDSTSLGEASILAILRSTLRLQESLVSKPVGYETTDKLEVIRQQIRRQTGNGRGLEDIFPMESCIRQIRARMETLLGDINLLENNDIRDIYGEYGYKCSKLWCQSFLSGFKTSQERDRHLSDHERPFRCSVHGCYGYQIGFCTEPDLSKHNTRLHGDEEVAPDFPFLQSVKAADIFQASAKGHLERVRELVEAGVDVNTSQDDKEGAYPLHLAAKGGHLRVCHYLLDHGAAVEAQCKNSRKTSLHIAVGNDDAEITSLLISKYGAEGYIHHRDSSGQSPVALAFKRNCESVVTSFPSEACRHKTCRGIECHVGYYGGTKLSKGERIISIVAAIIYRDAEAAESIIANGCVDFNYEAGNKHTTVPLQKVLSQADQLFAKRIATKLLLSGRVDMNRGDCEGKLPLHAACRWSQIESLIKEILSKTHSVHVRDKYGATPVSYLCQNGILSNTALQLFSSILEAADDTDMNEPDNQGNLPLHYVCGFARGEPGIIEPVITRTRNKDKRNATGFTPLHFAIETSINAMHVMGNVQVLLRKLDSVNLLNRADNMYTIAESASSLHGAMRGELLKLLFWDYPSIAAEVSARGVTALHFGAWALDAVTVERTIADNSASVNVSADGLPDAWEQNLQIKTADVTCPVARRLLLTPLFLAANSTLGKSDSKNRNHVLRILLNTEKLDFHRYLPSVHGRYQGVLIRLAARMAKDARLEPDLAARGFTLPWNQMFSYRQWATGHDEESLFMMDDLGVLLVPRSLVHAVLRGSRCKFLEVIKANFSVALRVLHWRELSRGDLDFAGEEEILIKVYAHGSVADLRRIIELGFDGHRALLGSVHSGITGLVRRLLQTGLMADALETAVDETGLRAYEISLREGHTEIAQILLDASTEAVQRS